MTLDPQFSTHHLDASSRKLMHRLQEWLRQSDPSHRWPSGVILLSLLEDGFAVQYLGEEAISQTELERRVIWVAQHILDSTLPI